MSKKLFFLIFIAAAAVYWLRQKGVQVKTAEVAQKKADVVKKNNVKGYETLNTGKYGIVTYTKATYDELKDFANTIARDLIEKNNGHWDAWGAYQKVEDLDNAGQFRKLWYLGFLIKKAYGMADGESLSARANRENWKMLSWTYLSKKDSDRLAQLGRNFVAVMAKVGH